VESFFEGPPPAPFHGAGRIYRIFIFFISGFRMKPEIYNPLRGRKLKCTLFFLGGTYLIYSDDILGISNILFCNTRRGLFLRV